MSITSSAEDAPWLLLVFTLPTSKASGRVQIWRKLHRLGSIPFRNAGYMLPNTPINQERFEWLATAIRGYDGDASILEIQAIDDLPPHLLQEHFRRARGADYSAVIEQVSKLKSSAKATSAQLLRLKRRYEDIVAIDFFESGMRGKAEEALTRAEQPLGATDAAKKARASKADHQHRTWMTRPRPGIDRVSSAWLISRFIDSKPKFIFGSDSTKHANAVPFDMFQAGGFGHEGDHCTFETLCSAFAVRDKKVQLIAEAIHDADLEDAKYGRLEGETMNQILQGWAKQGIADDELLRRGMDLIEGFYNSINNSRKSL
jgi:hypothetical protein